MARAHDVFAAPRRIALATFGSMILFGFTSCGGGGGAAPTFVLNGKLSLEQEPSSPSLAGLGLTVGERCGRDFEPNDHLFSAIDLGDLDASFPAHRVVSGEVGGAIDPRDVLRIGPVDSALAGRRLEIDLSGDTVVGTLHVEDGRGSPARSVANGAITSVTLEAGQELVIVLEPVGSLRGAWQLDCTLSDGSSVREAPASFLEPPVAAEKREAMLGGDAFRFAAGEVLVHCPDAAERLRALGFRRVSGSVDVGRYVRDGFSLPLDRDAGQWAQSDLLREVRRTLPEAQYVSPNIITPLAEALAGMPASPPLPPLDPNDEYWKKNEQFNLALTNFPQAWQTTTGSDSVHIAIVDTGMMIEHPDLAPRVSTYGYDFIADKDSAGDGDGIDSDPSEPPEFDIYFYHGTYVGGVAAAVTNNTIGVAGGTWKGKVLPIRVFGRLGGASYDRVQAYRYLAGQTNDSGRILPEAERPKVINLSFAIRVPTTAEHVEIQRLYAQNVKMVAAIDNQGYDPAPALYPAAWPEVLCCAAVDENLVRTTYSNAADYVDICAPGGTEIAGPKGVISTWALRLNGKLTYLYNSFLGTSVATPAISAGLALMESVHADLAPELARRILAETCKDLGPVGKDRYYGHGLLQVDLAVQRAIELDKAPLLGLTPQSFRFDDAVNVDKLSISNLGGRLLGDFAVQSVGSSSGALSFFVPEYAPGDLVMTLDRQSSLVGNHQETFRLDSNGGSLTFDVAWRRPIPPSPAGFEVWLSFDGRLVRQTRSAADGSFSFTGLAGGEYFLEAGVDRDQNGRLGDPQEWYLSRKIIVDETTSGELGGVIPWRN
ncbi:MAG: S8 family serine peptidase [Planctomycetes bacterium]|nr:S8 family serine peptidase [Planctomycetota bacterium]